VGFLSFAFQMTGEQVVSSGCEVLFQLAVEVNAVENSE